MSARIRPSAASRPFRRCRLLPLAALLAALLGIGACAGPSRQATPSASPAAVPGPAGAPFVERAAEVGLDFVHVNGMSGELYILEIMGPGAALLDYDRDGDLDVYLTQGHDLSGKPAEPPPSDRLYRNELIPSGTLRFTDVTAEAGIHAPGYGMGVAVDDYDRDGWPDLYVTNYGSNQLWHNRGTGADGQVTFEDVTTAARVDDPRWSTGAAFTDYDRDGWPDLVVVNYIAFTPANHVQCQSESRTPDYCKPTLWQPVPDHLWHNRGDGTFEDVTTEAGLDAAFGSGLGVIAADLDADGWPDLYVTNDGMENQLWHNGGPGADGRVRFTDQALLAGVALNREGKPEASMGVDAADFDGDGDDDLFLTHLAGESNTYYRNGGQGLLDDRSLEQGLATPSLPYTSFGTLSLDYDRDGWLDLLVVNGEVRHIPEQAASGEPLPLKQPNQLFHNRGDGSFEEVSDLVGGVFRQGEVSRAAAFGDLDNNGTTDVVVTTNNGPVRLWLGRAEPERHWLGLNLLAADGRRQLLGAEVTVYPAEATGQASRVLHRRAHSDGSYLAAHDGRVLVGLGTASSVTRVEVRWPDGPAGAAPEVFTDLAADRYHDLRRGTGRSDRP